jgi:hypothetical protein
MLMMMSPFQGAINYGREDKQIASDKGSLPYEEAHHTNIGIARFGSSRDSPTA